MVRKRPHRTYESDEEDSDSDFGGYESERSDPAPKRYSLRTRQKTTFAEEFDYNLDASDESERLRSSDDEDFCLEQENEALVYTTHNNTNNQIEEESQINDEDLHENGLIDFEDIIRADIVINKNRIDYDNAINRSEIKTNDTEQNLPPGPLSKKGRGRPPKDKDFVVPQVTITETPDTDTKNLLEPDTEVIENNENNDGCLNFKIESVVGNVNGVIVENHTQNKEENMENGQTEIKPALLPDSNLSEQKDSSKITENIQEDNSDKEDDDCILIVEKPDIIVLDDD